jgi:drug/metabolite transporter (DMT)-like permease
MRNELAIQTRDWVMLAALSVLWGGSFLFYRLLAFQLPPFTTVFGRVSLGAVTLAALVMAGGAKPWPPRARWGSLALLGLLNNVVPFSLFAWGESRVSGGTAAILNAMTPIFTVLVTGLVLRSEPLTGARIAGIGCGFAGVAVLVGPQALLGQDLLGQAACLAAALAYGFAVPYARTIKGLPPSQMAFGQLVGATAILLLPMLVVDRPWRVPAPTAAGWGALLGLAVLSTGVAYLLFFRLLARIGATNLVLVTFLVPISALLLEAVVQGEAITTQALAGMALIAAGLACIDGRLFGRSRRSRPKRSLHPAAEE